MVRSFPIRGAAARLSAAVLLTGTTLAWGAQLFAGQVTLPAPSSASGDGLQPPVLIVPAAPPPIPQLAPAEKPQPVIAAPPPAAPVKKAPAPVLKPALPAPAPAVKPVETLPSPPAPETVPVKPSAKAAVPATVVKPAIVPEAKPQVVVKTEAPPATSSASEGSWKILIRPEVYRAADPWEYVRTGQITWGAATPATTHDNKSSTAAAVGDVIPAMPVGPHAPVAAASGAPCGPGGYPTAYQSIPFSRAEYEANPSYRHDAAMELLFGTLRPTTIVKQNQPYFSRYPDMFRYRHTVYPYLAPGSNTVDINHYWNYNGYW